MPTGRYGSGVAFAISAKDLPITVFFTGCAFYEKNLKEWDKIIGERVLPADIKDGQVYIIVSKADGICVKRCINRLKNDNKLILKSDNKEFDNIIINAEDILETWSAKLRITAKINNPSDE